MRTVTIAIGFTEAERPHVASLYWQAFRLKLRPGFANEEVGKAVVQAALRPDHFIIARTNEGIVGSCGFYQDGSGAISFSWSNLRQHLSLPAALRASLILSILSRAAPPRTLVLDGLCVDRASRSQGIGTALLNAAADHARQTGAHAAQLTVVDRNPRARELYERRHFVPVDSGSLGVLGLVYGFRHYTTMELMVNQ